VLTRKIREDIHISKASKDMPFITYSVDDKTFHCEQRDKLVVIVLILSCPPKSPVLPQKKKKKKEKETKDCGITPCLDMKL
jgi:hypothetical protein